MYIVSEGYPYRRFTVFTVTSAKHYKNSIQMFNKNKSTTSKFYNELPKEELYSGYLQKSPVRSGLTNGIKSWRRRFFVLSKEGEDNYQLAYFKTNKKREKPLGEIDLSKVSIIYTSPEKHPMWEWIQKNFKCLPSSVLLLRVEDYMPKYARDYFLIGENSENVNGWHNEILKVLKTQPSQNKVTDDDLQQDKRFRAKTEPVRSLDCNEEPSQSALFRKSAPIYTFISPPLPDGYYDIPRKFSNIAISDDEEDDTEEQPETPEDNVDSAYMPMFSVNAVLQQSQQEEDACFQKKNSAEMRCSSDFNGNCASTEMNKGPPNKSETHKPVEKEICINRNDLSKTLIFTQKEGKPCVSECKQTETSHLFHKGDQILAFNDLEIETVDEIHTFLRRFSKDEVKLTILRSPGSQPFHAKPCSSL
ncbi:pleckstrin homology domain-containing family S member 1-like isoform X2 [Paramisgurnus dabryanus]|uniref:pleckstrin homology domain-containing family S member 1-like isoform X2 n=1 Tax=Paramisgurnus dabryanus TaxID=90735 RepID=UPI003CCF3CE8